MALTSTVLNLVDIIPGATNDVAATVLYYPVLYLVLLYQSHSRSPGVGTPVAVTEHTKAAHCHTTPIHSVAWCALDARILLRCAQTDDHPPLAGARVGGLSDQADRSSHRLRP